MHQLTETKAGQTSGLTKNDALIKRINNATEKEVEKIEDPIEKYKLEKYLNVQIFFTNLYGNIGIEQNDELMPRITFIIEYLKSCQYKKIISRYTGKRWFRKRIIYIIDCCITRKKLPLHKIIKY